MHDLLPRCQATHPDDDQLQCSLEAGHSTNHYADDIGAILDHGVPPEWSDPR
ncbi:hypothetical protein J1770_gp74 [Gordonia phage EMoore]|uniref:Uncharacterized protein n=1 Tax=Gordonia phage EMoore TaxID=2656534 RepID=A0A649VVB8_9CAUD|nr:hypothetical protein J1770_gp74 [Gordonia phage EMoore]QGJ95859.1 hypothetical protein SEA_EMOORE_74 [Gordonia phage EMoore]